MSLWKFTREANNATAGANNAAFRKREQPMFTGSEGDLIAKRSVIIANTGWVTRLNYTDMHGVARKKEQILVAAHPGIKNLSYTSNTYTGKPDIVQMYVKLNANGFIGANVTNANLYVVFNAPVNWKASGNLISITVANTASGNNAVARFANTLGQGRIVNANNTLVFRLPKLQANIASNRAPIATYKINVQTMAATGNPLYNPERGITAAANLQIAAPVSNNLVDGKGTIVTTFRVAPRNRQ